jgi:hypothetical protein
MAHEEMTPIKAFERSLLARANPDGNRRHKRGPFATINGLFKYLLAWRDKTQPVIEQHADKMAALEKRITQLEGQRSDARLDALEAAERLRNATKTIVRDKDGKITAIRSED